MKKLFYLVSLVLLFGFNSLAAAETTFAVKKIQFEGLQRTSPATVMSYLPIKAGDTLKPGASTAILRALYKTGFFDHVSLTRAGNNTLIIHLVERPTIGQLKINGNSVIPTDKLKTVLKTLDVVEGRVYNPVVLEKIKQGLLNQYYQLGRYNARVNMQATPMPRNRVLVTIDISEGLVTKVKRISFIGNHVFPEKTLKKQLVLSPSGVFTLVTQSDRYSEERLEASLANLRNFYLDKGFIRFEVKSSQAQMTPDKKSVYITISVAENAPYRVAGIEFVGDLIFPRAEVMKKVTIKQGEVFSRQKIIDTEKAITNLYGNRGYMFAAISVKPQVNDNTHQVILVFEIKPGKRTYIRHITFSENRRTNDLVLRREIQQMEAAPASTTKIETSKQRLKLLPYINEVEMSVNPVPDSEDEMDVNYKVKEDSSAQASVKLGYSQNYGLILGAGFNQKNILGTGNTLGINFQRTQIERFYGIDYTNPYYTEDGISRNISVSASQVDPNRGAGNIGYTTHDYTAGVMYGIPLGQEIGVYNRLLVGANYQDTLIKLSKNNISNQVNDFITRHGTHYQLLDFRLGFSRDSRDRAIFPTSGTFQTLFFDGYAPLSKNTPGFYSFNYAGRWYYPINNDFIFYSRANAGFGSGFNSTLDFPFYKYYHAGGIESVRGFNNFSMGPLDSLGVPIGGNLLADASIALIFPNYISDNLRTSAFFDAGNVYSTFDNKQFGGKSTNGGPVRFSVGVEVDWISPFGPVALSFGQRLNKNLYDQVQFFQFSLGANF